MYMQCNVFLEEFHIFYKVISLISLIYFLSQNACLADADTNQQANKQTWPTQHNTTQQNKTIYIINVTIYLATHEYPLYPSKNVRIRQALHSQDIERKFRIEELKKYASVKAFEFTFECTFITYAWQMADGNNKNTEIYNYLPWLEKISSSK